MDDSQIIELYLAKNEAAITETEIKYGTACHGIAYRILRSREDSEECVLDSYLKLWNSIPPIIPKCLFAYLARIVRNLSLNRYEKRRARKRGGGEKELVLDELSYCIPDSMKNEASIEALELAEIINGFLYSLEEEKATIFMQRYWYLCSIKEIAAQHKLSQSNVKTILLRLRETLKDYLAKEGVEV